MNDDEFGALLLRPLAGEPAGPPRIDVAKAMRDGRKMRRRRWWSGGTAITAVTATAIAGGVLAAATEPDKPRPDLPPDPTMPASCAVQRLPLGKHPSAEVSGGDPSGTYLVGWSDPVYGKKHAVLVWRDGKLIADVPVPGEALAMTDINGSGTAVGTSTQTPYHPYVFRNGKASRLRGGVGEAIAINDAGVIVGVLLKGDVSVPVRWATPDAEPEPLPVPAASSFDRVTDVAENGVIAGQAGGPEGQGYLWFPDGSHRRIAPPPVANAIGFVPSAFRYGWIYGAATIRAAGGAHSSLPYRYEPISGTWQPLPERTLDEPLPGAPNGLSADVLRVYVGNQRFQLPPYDPALKHGDAFVIDNAGDDARRFAGHTVSATADPKFSSQPLLWRCQ